MKNYMKHLLIIVFATCLWVPASAQDLVQTIRGSVSDHETSVPLFAANVAVYQDSVLCGVTITDQAGMFRLENIPLGRYTVIATYVVYRQVILPDIIVNSARVTP
jgi:hypothetical protein